MVYGMSYQVCACTRRTRTSTLRIHMCVVTRRSRELFLLSNPLIASNLTDHDSHNSKDKLVWPERFDLSYTYSTRTYGNMTCI